MAEIQICSHPQLTSFALDTSTERSIGGRAGNLTRSHETHQPLQDKDGSRRLNRVLPAMSCAESRANQ